jgi:hypothetical protein
LLLRGHGLLLAVLLLVVSVLVGLRTSLLLSVLVDLRSSGVIV